MGTKERTIGARVFVRTGGDVVERKGGGTIARSRTRGKRGEKQKQQADSIEQKKKGNWRKKKYLAKHEHPDQNDHLHKSKSAGGSRHLTNLGRKEVGKGPTRLKGVPRGGKGFTLVGVETDGLKTVRAPKRGLGHITPSFLAKKGNGLRTVAV